MFHATCVKAWIDEHFNCPTCRASTGSFEQERARAREQARERAQGGDLLDREIEQLKWDNEQLKWDNEQLKRDNEQLKWEIEQLEQRNM